MFKYLKLSLLLLCLTLNINQVISTCSDTQPVTASDCTNQQSFYNYCCYAKGLGSRNDTLCYEIPKTAYSGSSSATLNGTTYSVNCGNVSQSFTPLAICGPSKPASVDDCKLGSTNLISCCYNSGYGNISPACYNLQTKYKGKLNWANIDLECSAEYLNFSMILTLAFLIALF